MKYFLIEAGGCMVEAKTKADVPKVMGYPSMQKLLDELQIERGDIEEITKEQYDSNELYDMF